TPLTHSSLTQMETPRPQFPPKVSYRSCMICAGPTKCSHMGIDACRACSTFYRRTREKNTPLVCRTGTGRCTLDRDEGFTCKKCRFERFSQVLEGSKADNPTTSNYVNRLVQKITTDDASPSPIEQPLFHQTVVEKEGDGLVKDEEAPPPPPLSFPPIPPSQPSSSAVPPPASSSMILPRPQPQMPTVSIPRCTPIDSLSASQSLERRIMNRIKQSYSLLCLVRRTSELANRRTPLYPLQAASGDISYVPATMSSLNQSTRILVTALFDFASSAFDEFGTLDSNEKWLLVKNFTQSFSCIESFYRSHLIFPGKDNICMAGYTAYFDFNDIQTFFSDSPNPANAEQAKESIHTFLKDNSKIFHDIIRRINPSEEEFLALLGLAFWNIDSTPASETLIAVAERNRRALLHELHVLYKEEKRQTEYAGRLGDLFFFMMTYQTCIARMPEKFEYFRLLDLIDDNDLVYQMNKTE
ncbi:hypothetical protein PMAYCL1PPCAC_17748, partial [Pristionchus mayeri]